MEIRYVHRTCQMYLPIGYIFQQVFQLVTYILSKESLKNRKSKNHIGHEGTLINYPKNIPSKMFLDYAYCS